MFGRGAFGRIAFARGDEVAGAIVGPSLYADPDTFFEATITTGEVGLAPALYEDADTFHAAAVSHVLHASLYADADSFFSPALDHVLHAELYADPDTFHAAAILETLVASLFVDGDTFFAATITTGAVTLTPSLFIDADTFYEFRQVPSAPLARTLSVARRDRTIIVPPQNREVY